MTSFISQAWSRRPTLSVELENKGSVARDHLAGERTFLAWLRTSLALVSLGIAIAQLFKLPEIIEPERRKSVDGDGDPLSHLLSDNRLQSLEALGKPLGAICIALGALCLVMGSYRFFVVQKHLLRGVFPPSRVEISLMALLVGALIVAAFGVIVGVKLKS